MIGLAMCVHDCLSPGLLEPAYHRCLCHELSWAGIPFRIELRVGIDVPWATVVEFLVNNLAVLQSRTDTPGNSDTNGSASAATYRNASIGSIENYVSVCIRSPSVS